MKKKLIFWTLALSMSLVLVECGQQGETKSDDASQTTASFGGFESQVAWGNHLVTICGCNDCHTPKLMTPEGPILDSANMLSGHPVNMPTITTDFDKNAMSMKGLVVARDLTEWSGPWGVSYSANLTPDETGIGNWTEEQFFTALRKGKSKGLEGSRMLLPPMPWEMFQHMTDDEIKAVFAYLKSIKPVSNLVPPPVPPAGAQ